MTQEEAGKLVDYLREYYPSRRVTDFTRALYTRFLLDIDFGVGVAALARLIATRTFFPSVAEIREAALIVEHGEVRPGGDAWGEVLRAIGRYGRGRRPGVDFEFSDKLTTRCVRSIGWSQLCDSELSASERKRFVELYDRLADEQRRSQLVESLPAMQRFRQLQAALARSLSERKDGHEDEACIAAGRLDQAQEQEREAEG